VKDLAAAHKQYRWNLLPRFFHRKSSPSVNQRIHPADQSTHNRRYEMNPSLQQHYFLIKKPQEVSDFLFSSFLMAYQLHKAIMKEKEASSL
jgi:hypothetical protein